MTCPMTQQEAFDLGIEAHVYLYPLILMDITRRVTTNFPAGTRPAMGPMNEFHHFQAFPPASFREVVRPNFDTLYSIAWLDLTREPMIVSMPDTNGRYYLLPMLDMWSDVFACPGKRTSGTQAAAYAVVQPGWNGNLPAGIEKIEAPTPYVWIIGRTQTNGPRDYAAVHQVQAGYTVTPLSKWGKPVEPVKFVNDPNTDMKTPPMVQADKMSAAQYFSYGAELMKLHPPHITDWSQIARLKRIGIQPGKSLDWDSLPDVVRDGLEKAIDESLKRMKVCASTFAPVKNGWLMGHEKMGVYGNQYLSRAIVAMIGLGANQPEDAIYPLCVSDAAGNPLEGSNNYVLHFEKGHLPPVDAFWSITMYDAEGFPYSNELDRCAIGDRDDLKYNADGSLDIYLQHVSPGADKESNWLPSPGEGILAVTMRLYAPKSEIVDGSWLPPAIKRAE